MRILAIESSCDETAAALLYARQNFFALEANEVASQIDIHKMYGGVVPEVAARNHVLNILPAIRKVLGKKKPDCIAVTAGPGLVTSLLVGIETARTLSYAWNVPLIAVNHIEGHIYANWLAQLTNGKLSNSHFQLNFSAQTAKIFPSVVLVASGGHTELILMKNHGKYQLLGATRDDAAGEAFDKVAKILGLGYPGGPVISQYAEQMRGNAYSLPRPMISSEDYQFSFSGLKTAALYLVVRLKQEKKFTDRAKKNLCASFQQAVVDVLIEKTIRAASRYCANSVMLCGGVAANSALRKQLAAALERRVPNTRFYVPSLRYCTDNAAMIAAAGYFHALKKDYTPWNKIDARPNWTIH